MSTINLTSGAFITTWETTSSDESISMGTILNTDYNFTIDWGDGVTETISGTFPTVSHTYSTPGEHQIKIYANSEFNKKFPEIQMSSSKIKYVEQWGSVKWESMIKTFDGCANLIDDRSNDAPDLSNVTSMKDMFRGATNFNGDIESWDVSNVTTMWGMFEDASSFNQPLNNWDVSSVTSMFRMFTNASSFNQDLNDWDVSNVRSFGSTFQNATSFNGNVSDWDVSTAAQENGFRDMFRNAENFNQDISGWNMAGVGDLANVFLNASSFNQDISNWDVSSLASCPRLFEGATSFDQDLRSWDVSELLDATDMFLGATAFSDESAAKTVAGWTDPDVNAGSNTTSDLNSGGAQLGMPENDYSNFDQYEVDSGGTPTTGKEAIDALCSDPPNWTIDMGGTEPTDCT